MELKSQTKNNPLGVSAWSWNDIFHTYKAIGQVLQNYKDTADRFELDLPIKPTPGALIFYPEGGEEFVSQFYEGVILANRQIAVLDREIERRQKLVGTFG